MGLNIRSGLVAAAAVLASAGAWANSYTIVDLGVNKFPIAIDAQGEVAGNLTNRLGRAGVWTGDHWHHFKGPAVVYAMNSVGDVVGLKSPNPEIWLHGGKHSPLQAPPESVHMTPVSITDDGTVLESVSMNDNGDERCFIKSPDNQFVDLGKPQGFEFCEPTAMNAAGQVAGTVGTDGGYPHAFFWANGQFIDLGSKGAGYWSGGLAINSAGEEVGQAIFQNTAKHAFLWANDTLTDLGTDSDYTSSQASAINDQGLIVGFALPLGAEHTHAVRFADGNIIDLISEVVGAKGWELEQATAVNNDGSIVGFGSHSFWNGSHWRRAEHGFMLIPNN